MAKTCALEIQGTDQMKYDKTELKVAGDCTEVKVTLHHAGKMSKASMGLGWVLVKTADYAAARADTTTAGVQNGYVPKDDPKIIAAIPIIGGGETSSVTFPTTKLEKGGDYTYFCPFPGHFVFMHGKFIFG